MKNSVGAAAPPPRLRVARDVRLAWRLAQLDLRRRYAHSLGGVAWYVLSPLLTIATYYVVFGIGLKVAMPSTGPFFPFFISGMLPWLVFADAVTASTDVLTRNRDLISNAVFPLHLLPLSRLVSAFAAHLAVLTAVVILFCASGRAPGFHVIGVVYYMVGLGVLAAGFSFLLSAVNVVFSDTREILGFLLPLLFFTVPIIWPLDLVPAQWHWLINVNPMAYIVEGYRQALLYDHPISDNPLNAVAFWLIAGCIFVAGRGVFKRLQSELAELM
ncbi:MAG TPA: ABC transporter permease [Stellaceae bacterium]|nr:ABC transporter permease [Stellaceae bacterium]